MEVTKSKEPTQGAKEERKPEIDPSDQSEGVELYSTSLPICVFYQIMSDYGLCRIAQGQNVRQCRPGQQQRTYPT
jgi:hypothetical protein